MVEEQLLPTWLESLGVRCTLRKQKSRFDSGGGIFSTILEQKPGCCPIRGKVLQDEISRIHRRTIEVCCSVNQRIRTPRRLSVVRHMESWSRKLSPMSWKTKGVMFIGSPLGLPPLELAQKAGRGKFPV